MTATSDVEEIALIIIKDRHNDQIAHWHKESNSPIWQNAVKSAKLVVGFVVGEMFKDVNASVDKHGSLGDLVFAPVVGRCLDNRPRIVEGERTTAINFLEGWRVYHTNMADHAKAKNYTVTAKRHDDMAALYGEILRDVKHKG